MSESDSRNGRTADASDAGSASPATLPGVGECGLCWWAVMTLLAAIVLNGVWAYSRQLLHGEIVTGMRTIGAGGATWGLYIVFVIFFIGVSFAGITVAALIRLFDIRAIRPLSRIAELLTIVSLMMGALCVLVDLGQPLKGLLYLPRYARTLSPFFGTFSLVIGGYLFASLVYFYLAGRADAATCAARGGRLRWFYRLWASGFRGTHAERRRHHRASFWLSLFILPLLVTAHSTLGFIFGIQGGRPGWFNALQGPGFVVMAGVSGTGLLIVIAAAARRFLHVETTIRQDAFRWLGNLLLVLIFVYLYFMIAEELTANYAALESEKRIAHEIVFGAYAGIFWTTAGSLVAAAAILFAQFVRGKTSIPWTVAAAVLVNVAAVLKRYLLVIPSQTHGLLLPYETGRYVPSAVEIAVVGGLLALGALLYLVFIKVFPIIPAEVPVDGLPPAPAPPGERLLRAGLSAASLLVGIALAAVGFLASSRVGMEPYLDPSIPFSPLIFIAGVMGCFLSAVVYETLPPGRKSTAA